MGSEIFPLQKELSARGALYVAPCCGTVIESWQRNDLVRAGRWIATAPAPGKHRSYHFDAFSSPFVPWDVIAKQIVEAGENPSKLKTLYNLWFGLPYEMKGSAPDHKALADRAAKLKRYHVPAARPLADRLRRRAVARHLA
jgi:phage terminase large subunit GpA-like protein